MSTQHNPPVTDDPAARRDALEPDAISEFCKGFDQGYAEATNDVMAARLDRDQIAAVIEEYMTDGGTEFRAYDLADRLLKRFIPPVR